MDRGTISENGVHEKHWVLLVDDHPLIRERLASLIHREPDLTVCGEADDLPSARHAVEHLRPDVAVIDLQLKDGYGIDLIRELRDQHPGLPTVVLSMHAEIAFAEEAIRAGAYGYVTKQEPTELVLEAIRRALRNQLCITEPLAAELIRRLSRGGQGTLAEQLTVRELEVFQLLGAGLPARDIAARLGISAKTVEAHRNHIKEKLNVRTARELIRYAVRATSHTSSPDLQPTTER